jgi:hypothetical protein
MPPKRQKQRTMSRAAHVRAPLRLRMAPPQIASNVIVNHTYRFTSTSNAVQAISSSDLVLAAGCVGSSTNATVSSFFSSVKVSKIEIWAPPAAQGSSATCSLEWASQSNANNFESSDTSVSTAQPAHISTRPPARALASFWQTPGIANAQMCNIVAPTGSIIDVHMQLILQDDDNGSVVTRAVATAVVGTVYYLALDNATGHVYPPVSLTTTF